MTFNRKKLLKLIATCPHTKTKKDDLFKNCRVCLRCGLVIGKTPFKEVFEK